MNANLKQIISLVLVLTIRGISSTDITSQAFGAINDSIISAFGDFNSDELTDVFVRSTDGRTLEILLASDQEPLLRRSTNTTCVFKNLNITSIIPGDFDGDAYMDLLITTKNITNNNGSNDENGLDTNTAHPHLLDVYVNWGGADALNCTDEAAGPLFQMIGEPVALDYNSDMIIDLFGLNDKGKRAFWIFNHTHESPQEILMKHPHKHPSPLKVPHSHAYLDLNNDFMADLFLSTENGNEIWLNTGGDGFKYSSQRNYTKNFIYGQSIFLDIELNGIITQVVPVCIDSKCHISAIFAYVNGEYQNLAIDFGDEKNQMWGFIPPDPKQQSVYQNTITLRGGDFNLDGYPDMIVTLQSFTGIVQTFLMENVRCETCGALTRHFAIQWNAFSPYSNGTVVGAFYDFYQVRIFSAFFRIFNFPRAVQIRSDRRNIYFFLHSFDFF